jgi:hypothetical protein
MTNLQIEIALGIDFDELAFNSNFNSEKLSILNNLCK